MAGSRRLSRSRQPLHAASGPRAVSGDEPRSGAGFPIAARLLALAALLGVAMGIGVALNRGGDRHRALFVARFPSGGLVTNEFAYHNPGNPHAIRSSDWVATSGSLFARQGAGWSGVPDGVAPGPGSTSANDSAVLRLRTRRDDFRNVAVSFRVRLTGLVTTARTPARAYDGVHIWLRYQNPDWLYFASVSRRDGRIVIGKKLPAASGGRYTDIVRVPNHPLPHGRWEPVRVTIDSSGRAVVIEVFVGGRRLARAVDNGDGGPAILRAGRVGIRGDNADFEFRDFEVSPL